MRQSILSLALLLLTSLVSAQTTPLPEQLTGWVTDTDKQALPSTQLILKNGEAWCAASDPRKDGQAVIF